MTETGDYRQQAQPPDGGQEDSTSKEAQLLRAAASLFLLQMPTPRSVFLGLDPRTQIASDRSRHGSRPKAHGGWGQLGDTRRLPIKRRALAD